MGWSCSSAASETEARISKACRESTGSSNTWRDDTGEYFYEASQVEHEDGAITGTVKKMVPRNNTCRPCGSFRIDGDGRFAIGPQWMRDKARG